MFLQLSRPGASTGRQEGREYLIHSLTHTLIHPSIHQGNLGKTPEQSLVPRTGSCRFLEDGEWAGQVIKAGMKEAETMHLYDTYL